MSEEWRPVIGHEKEYKVSNQGRVRSLDRILGNNRLYKGQILKPITTRKRCLLKVNIKNRNRAIGTLVAEAFIGECPAGMVVRHMDGDRHNDRLENLCYGTAEEQFEDYARAGTQAGRKLDRGLVREIRAEYADGMTIAEISKAHWISTDAISQI